MFCANDLRSTPRSRQCKTKLGKAFLENGYVHEFGFSFSQSKTKNTEKLHFVYGILKLESVFASELSQSLNQTKL